MTTWKQGCSWGKNSPSYYEFIKAEKIVISPTRNFQDGDLIAIAEGFQIRAIAKIKSAAMSVTQEPNLSVIDKEYAIHYEDSTFFYEATWLILDQPIEYNTVQGCIKIKKQDLVQRINKIWNDSLNNKLPADTLDEKSIYPLNIIFYGPPGTGKTYHTINKALEIIDPDFYSVYKNKDGRKALKERFDKLREENKIVMTTFHQSYAYEDFVEGLRASVKDEKIVYSIEPGVFKKICEDAEKNLDENFVLIIDEINRGNVSNIFGELITLIEESKRAGKDEALSVTLPYSKETFSVPSNLYIVGTMNTADRSLTQIDTALRRRFHFEEMMPDSSLLKDIDINGIDIRKLLECLNKRIEALYDREHTLGHAFFMELLEEDKKNIDTLAAIFKNKVIPLLQEYFFDDWGKIQLILGDTVIQKKEKFIQFAMPVPDNLVTPDAYKINYAALDKSETYTAIYVNCPSTVND